MEHSYVIKQQSLQKKITMIELITVFKKMKLNNVLEDIFSSTTEFMIRINTHIPLKNLIYKLPTNSPILYYKKRIYSVYKRNNMVIYKPKPKNLKYSKLIIAMIPFIFILIDRKSVG